MRKMKTTILSMMLVVVMVVCSACMQTSVQVKIEEDGSSTIKMETLIGKAEVETLKPIIYKAIVEEYGQETADKLINQYFAQIESCDVVTVEGKEYYQYIDENSFNDIDEMQTYLQSAGFGSVSVGTDHFYAALAIGNQLESTTADITDEEMQELNKTLQENGLTMLQVMQMINGIVVNLTVELPENITYSNGEYEENSNTVTWTMTAAEMQNMGEVKTLYADTMEPSVIENDTESPVVSGIKNDKYYKKVTISASDNVGLAAIILDGTPVASKITSADLLTEGEHSIKAIDFTGNSTTINFIYDMTKPTVKGVSNGKTYQSARTIKFSDKYGVKSAKLNGKNIKTNKKVSKKGTYTLKVTDNSGNITTVKFKIK